MVVVVIKHVNSVARTVIGDQQNIRIKRGPPRSITKITMKPQCKLNAGRRKERVGQRQLNRLSLSLSLFVARRAAESAGICNAVATKIREHTNETQQYRSSPDEMQDRKGTTSKQCLHCNISRYLPLLIPTVEPSMSRRKKKWSKVFLSCNARSRDWT